MYSDNLPSLNFPHLGNPISEVVVVGKFPLKSEVLFVCRLNVQLGSEWLVDHNELIIAVNTMPPTTTKVVMTITSSEDFVCFIVFKCA